jgi:prepilin-type N-terminal cleavage/methylation domain-containing protein
MTCPMHRSKGFSLVEVLIATVLVGLALAALVAANSSFTMANDAGSDLSTAEFLIEQIREMTTMFQVAEPNTATENWIVLGPEAGETLSTYDDLDDFDGSSFCPPINANRVPLTTYAHFSQQIKVEKLNPSDFTEVWADNTTSNFVRVTVTVSLNGQPIASTNWVRAKY